MGRLFLVNLEGKSYSCKHCKTNLALCDDVVAKSFHTRHGKASLFSKVVNVYARKKEDRMMMLKRLSRRTNPSHQPKDYIHVRARRGQATDRHSLAERARREKISEKMTALQDIFRDVKDNQKSSCAR